MSSKAVKNVLCKIYVMVASGYKKELGIDYRYTRVGPNWAKWRGPRRAMCKLASHVAGRRARCQDRLI